MDKYSGLLRSFVNYSRKKFYNIGPSAQKSIASGSLGIYSA